jgi:arginase
MTSIKILNPEWQGFGTNNHASVGSLTIHKAFKQGNKFIEIDVLKNEELSIEGGILGHSSIIKNSKIAFNELNSIKPDRIFMIGGTCGSEIAPVAYLNSHYESNLAVLWFDAHGDLNTPGTSPSGHFHGMVLRTLLGEGDPDILELISHPLVPSQVTLAGVRNLDISEKEYITTKNITTISPEILTSFSSIAAAIEQSGTSNLYIHIDLDFFNPCDFNGAQVPVSGGITVEQFTPILSELNLIYNIIGISIVEFISKNLQMALRIRNLFEKSGLTHFL